ncbi:MAG: acetyl-CoA carboxylase biotin carboxylase subunit [Geminicoccaceae bacterium]|nr:acetyl-CoA carboxylase biotin carboxylase subunit [Geminicoccaceae bacterium]MDW8124145.1 acetyl-CoA carboxylase biotin carboxylase subunit [Geminicoccaceae bacterium]MDW8342563.1 acetyl-CoA carboxylase biotin carboxylase subunit [Geminicoccaceae bacterium]
MFRKILIANRGEVALRILRACRELGIATVAVHSTADATAMHVRLADESVCIGPPPPTESYLNPVAILAAAEITGAEAIHPGYGFLAENADFAQMVIEHGFAFIGPDPEHLRIMGDKIRAKRTARELGLPVVPGTEDAVGSEEEALEAAERIGYPLLIKAVAGGGGRGMTVVQGPSQLREAMRLARREAKLGFGDERVYLERYLERPRHIEIQVLGDRHGHLVHLGERDCTLQRRHQKVVEEAPSLVLSPDERAEIGERVVSALARLGYHNAGTVEFLWQDGRFYFIEMNTRLQVEHPVTELVTGIDIVREQIRIAAGERLGFAQKDVRVSGHAIEVRVTAEDPRTLTPSPGRVTAYHPPGGPGVRVDSALYAGYTVPPHYDSLIAKLVVHDVDRAMAIRRLERALAEFVIDGTATNLPLLRALFANREIREGRFDTRWLGQFLQNWRG